MIEEIIEPGLRYCSYQLSRKGEQAPDMATLLDKFEGAWCDKLMWCNVAWRDRMG